MRRLCFFVSILFGIAILSTGQTTSSDSQTLQALLTEVRGLHKDLQVSLAGMQSAEILLSRLQLQEVAVTRASQHLDEARSKSAEIRIALKSEAAEVEQLENHSPIEGETPEQVADALNRARAEFDVSTSLGQQRQAIADEAEQQLRTEQETLKALESQLDELVKNVGSFNGQTLPR
jgi:flagellar motility protein MotE (MotC chaperone)